MFLCVDVPNTFGAFMRLSISERQSRVVVRLCQLHFQHPSLISWYPDLLHTTIKFLLSQCDGDHLSHFVTTAIPLAELATTVNVYPHLTDLKQSRYRVLYLWDFMSQAEIYTLLCVFLQFVCRQLGPSQVKLDFTIMASRRSSDANPQLSVSSVGPGEFQQRVELALMDNLGLSITDFRRTDTNEWWVMILDIASVMKLLPIDTNKAAVYGDRRRKSSSESRESSLFSSNSESWATPKRKVLLATPSAVPATSCDKLQQQTIVSQSVPPLITSSVSPASSSKFQTDRRVHHSVVPVLPVTPHVQPQSPAVHGLRVISQPAVVSVSVPVVDFTVPPPSYNSALPTSAAYYSVPNYQVSPLFPVSVAQRNFASPGGPIQMVIPAVYSSVPNASNPVISLSNRPGTVPIEPLMSRSVSVASTVFASYSNVAALPVSMPTSFPCTRYNSSQYSYYQQPSPLALSAWTSPPVARCRMTAAGKLL